MKLTQIRRELDALPAIHADPHFRIHCHQRDPWPGLGRSVGGISGRVLLDAYIEGLRKAFEHLSAQRKHIPKTPIPVYIFHIPEAADSHNPNMKYGWPFAWTDRNDPFIALPSRTRDTVVNAALDRARVEAAHEVVHLFNAATPLANHAQLPDWRWLAFDEATALFMERQIIPGARSTLFYCSDWIDHPEHALVDMDKGIRPSWIFLKYLSDAYPDLVTKLWNNTKGHVGPYAAIETLAGRSFEDLFALYAAESYFTSRVCPDLHDLHQPCRACTHSSNALPYQGANHLDPLACRYYRFRLPTNAGIRVQVESAQQEKLAGFLAVCGQNMHPVSQIQLARAQSGAALQGVIPAAHIAGCDHVVATVANCETESTQKAPGEIQFTLTAEPF